MANAGELPEEQDLYGLAEPLAKSGDVNNEESERTRQGTRISQDQQGYQN